MSKVLGIIAGNTDFPLRFARDARANGFRVVVAAHRGETSAEIEQIADDVLWIKVGELGKLISYFKNSSASQVVMAGGISRVKLFGGVKLDMRGTALLARLRSTKDDIIMRGIAEELLSEGIEVKPCTMFSQESLTKEKVYTRTNPTAEEMSDIEVGREALIAMGSLHIGQLVVVRDGVIVAVEAVEGTDAAILRGGELGGKGTVVVKFAKPTQDMRFDVPTVGLKTIETMRKVKARVLALEAGRSIILDPDKVLALANKSKISIIGCPALVTETLNLFLE